MNSSLREWGLLVGEKVESGRRFGEEGRESGRGISVPSISDSAGIRVGVIEQDMDVKKSERGGV